MFLDLFTILAAMLLCYYYYYYLSSYFYTATPVGRSLIDFLFIKKRDNYSPQVKKLFNKHILFKRKYFELVH